MTVRILVGDALARLRELPDESIHCCVTSPPYWGLRAYGGKGGGMIGLEPTLPDHIEALVGVFREVRRVLRDDGTLWLNYGDAYAGGGRGWSKGGTGPQSAKQRTNLGSYFDDAGNPASKDKLPPGCKPKDLLLMPAQVALALRDDGWWLRSDIIWAKPNPMPESVFDRPSSAHEHIFLMSKSRRYFYDADAVRQPYSDPEHRRYQSPGQALEAQNRQPGREREREDVQMAPNAAGANLRNVWSFSGGRFEGNHFATFPTELVERCVAAGTSAKGVCPDCLAPFRRVASRSRPEPKGWEPTCGCPGPKPIPATVLDPFGGAGTTGMVAARAGRDSVLIEISPEYADMARKRLECDMPLLSEVEIIR